MSTPIRCIECYKTRPGGRCTYCPLHKDNKDSYRSLGNGNFIPVSTTVNRKKQNSDNNES